MYESKTVTVRYESCPYRYNNLEQRNFMYFQFLVLRVLISINV